MDFRILGPLEVESDGRLLAVGSRHPRTLLAVLLLSPNRVVSRDRLVDAIWGEEPPPRAANALQVYVSQLRKALGRDAIVTQAPGYLIRVGDEELDLDRFEQLLAEARASDSAAARAALHRALGLWRGPPLADLDDVPSLEPARRRLAELRLAAVEERIEAELTLGEHAALVPELEALVAEHPLRERLRGQLMLALYRCGRQAEALDTYRRARQLMADELGLEPGEALRRLERSILEQEPALAGPPPRLPPRERVPTGTVTFLFTDVEGSTRLMEELGDDYGALLDEHNRLLRKALVDHGGLEVANQADAFFYAFRRARDAVEAAIEAQRAVLAAAWPRGAAVKIRIGIHTGEPGIAEGGYHGLDVVRAARVSGAAHGGQVLVSSATRDLVWVSVAGASFRDLGDHRLPEIGHPQRIFQVLAPGLPDEFPELRTEDGARVMPIHGREAELAAAAEAAVGAEVRRLRLFRRSRVAAVVGAVIVAGTTAGIALVLTGGGRSGRIVVRPNSVAVVDPGTDRLVADVPVGARPVAVAAGLGGVWVANADDGTVSEIDPRSRQVVATIGIGADVSDIAVGFGSVWVADGNDSTLTRIDPTLSPPAIQETYRFGGASSLAPEPVFSVAVGAGAVWITRGNRLVRIDPASGATHSSAIPPPIALGAGAGDVWVTTEDERLLRISPSGQQTGSYSLPSSGLVARVGDGFVWVIVTIGDGAVWQFDPGSVTPDATTTTSIGPNDLAVGEHGVWAAGNGVVLRLDPASGAVGRRISLGLPAAAVAAGEGGVWVAIQPPS